MYTELLGPDGPLAAHVPGFAPRVQQQTLCAAVGRILDTGGVLVAEAGTGTGKTYAYLAPALLSGAKVIISTGTRNLQDQLFHKDLPVVRTALGLSSQVALLKGRSNYLCLHRLHATLAAGRLKNRQLVSELHQVWAWAEQTVNGDVAEVAEVAEDSPIWRQVTSTTDNCLGGECPHIQDCHVVKARRRALEADLLVINHHLLFADLVLREQGFAELLPGADVVILDEAHQLAEVAGQFFGLSLSGRQLLDLARDSQVEQSRDAGDDAELGERALGLERAAAALRLSLGEPSRRLPWADLAGEPTVAESCQALALALDRLGEALDAAAPRGKGLETCARRCKDLQERLEQLTAAPDGEHVQWLETRGRGFFLNLTPLDVGPTFRDHMARCQNAWVFTSATLAVGESFAHFIAGLGLGEPETLRLDSPFDFPRNALLYHPEALPNPTADHFTRAVVEAALPVLEASRGRAFMLFTSYRALREAAALLDGRLDYPLLVQGGLPRGELLERFRRLGNAVLLGTGSFWEGVDVRGPALSCVIIDKLPFASPGDPVLAARIDALRRRGGNPFLDHQVPAAVIALKQGVGRLIRDVDDRGVLMLCDPRLLTKPYGRLFLDSLPAMTRTRRLERVQQFFELEHHPDPRPAASSN